VEDSAAAARYLAERGDIDPARVEITGGSAGGYTTLLALAVRDEFAAGTSQFGVADLVTFHEDTHKFESHYDEYLVGPWPAAIENLERVVSCPHASRRQRPAGGRARAEAEARPPPAREARDRSDRAGHPSRLRVRARPTGRVPGGRTHDRADRRRLHRAHRRS